MMGEGITDFLGAAWERSLPELGRADGSLSATDRRAGDYPKRDAFAQSKARRDQRNFERHLRPDLWTERTVFL